MTLTLQPYIGVLFYVRLAFKDNSEDISRFLPGFKLLSTAAAICKSHTNRKTHISSIRTMVTCETIAITRLGASNASKIIQHRN